MWQIEAIGGLFTRVLFNLVKLDGFEKVRRASVCVELEDLGGNFVNYYEDSTGFSSEEDHPETEDNDIDAKTDGGGQ